MHLLHLTTLKKQVLYLPKSLYLPQISPSIILNITVKGSFSLFRKSHFHSQSTFNHSTDEVYSKYIQNPTNSYQLDLYCHGTRDYYSSQGLLQQPVHCSLFSQLLCDNTDICIIASCGISPAIQFYNYCFMHF